MSETTLDLNENVEALLSYVLGAITGIVFLVLEKKSDFVKFHAAQSIVFSISVLIISWILGIIPFVGWILSSLFNLLAIAVWILLMIKAYNHEKWELPVISDLAIKLIK